MQSRILSLATVSFLSALTSIGAMGAAQRTFVASTGSDANPCSIAAPCRGFARAITQTTSGGEVIVLDSAGYGPVIIAQSVSIIAPPGIYAGISVFSGVGIDISTAGLNVVLRGLTFNGEGGSVGVQVSAASDVTIDHAFFNALTNSGVLAIGAGARVMIGESFFYRNGYAGANVSSGATMTLDHVRIERGAYSGIVFDSNTSTRLFNSVIADNDGNGIIGTQYVSGKATFEITDTQISGQHNSEGIFIGAADVVGARAELAMIRGSLERNFTGMAGSAPGAGVVALSISNSLISGNISTGLQPQDTNVSIAMSDNVFMNNGWHWIIFGGSIFSAGGNVIGPAVSGSMGALGGLPRM